MEKHQLSQGSTEISKTANTRLMPWALLILIAVVAAIIPNIGQQLYDFGADFQLIGFIVKVSYFVFAIVLIAAWIITPKSKLRWAVLALAPIAYFQPIRWGLVMVLWSIRGFAP